MRALIIDDSKAIRRILSRYMTDLGFEIFEAGTGGEALRQFEAIENLDVALVDWNLPEMTGYDIICEIRKQERFNDVRLVMVTTETEMSQMIKAMEAGANEYVMKPFTRLALIEKLGLAGLSIR